MKENRLIIPRAEKSDEYGATIRLSNKAYALLCDLSKRSGRSQRFIASKMIEFAFDMTDVSDSAHLCDDDECEVYRGE